MKLTQRIVGFFLILIFAVSVLSSDGPTARAQSGEWAWMAGGNEVPPATSCTGNGEGFGCGVPGVYGTLGVPAPTNTPGARTSALLWTDGTGNLWLFGGYGPDSTGTWGYLNDLWEFNPVTRQWTWVNGSSTIGCTQVVSATVCGEAGVYGQMGIAASGNVPGGRSEATGWIDKSGNLWLFGGAGFDSAGFATYLNDMWEFTPSTGQWRWVSGSNSGNTANEISGTLGVAASTNVPGGRFGAVSWSDSEGNFWLFGGQVLFAYGISYSNHLWRFSPSNKQWTWMAGGDAISCHSAGACGQTGTYGNLGVPAATNSPGGRERAQSWTDNEGNFWLYGGTGLDSVSSYGFEDDLWEFTPSTGEWAWMGGDNTVPTGCAPIQGVICGQDPVYGTAGASAAGNTPGGVSYASTWTDASGKLWLFGGGGNNWLFANSLWSFDRSVNQWTWMSGSTHPTIPGVYGVGGVPSANNVPGGRSSAAAATDAMGHFWFFGGNGIDENGTTGVLNDLWEYIFPAATPVLSIAPGTYTSVQTVTISDSTPGATIYYTMDGTTPTTSSAAYSGPITVSTTETIKAIAVASGYVASPVASAAYTINLPVAATPAFSVSGGAYTSVQTVTISDATAGATIYYTTDGTAPTSSSTPYSGPITVAKSETIQAIASASGYTTSAVASATYTISLPPPTFTFAASPTSMSVNAGGTGTATLTVTPQNGFNALVSFACSGLQAGATCAFSPTTVTPSTGVATTTLTITAPAKSAAVRLQHGPGWPLSAVAMAVCLLGWRRRHAIFVLVAILSAALGMGMLSACGGGGNGGGGSSGGGSTPVTSTVTVTATAGSLQQTAAISLTVN